MSVNKFDIFDKNFIYHYALEEILNIFYCLHSENIAIGNRKKLYFFAFYYFREKKKSQLN
jgi:hypothetical protein